MKPRKIFILILLYIIVLFNQTGFGDDKETDSGKDKNNVPKGNDFIFCQLKYKSPNWDPYPSLNRDIKATIDITMNINMADKRKIIEITDPDLFTYPFIYMTGLDAFEPFTELERKILKKYLLGGGFLFIEDVIGNKDEGFDKSIKRELSYIFPNKQLEKLPWSHSIFRSFYLIRRIGGRKITNLYIEGINFKTRTPVIYSQNDLGGALAMDNFGKYINQCVPDGETQRKESLKLFCNILMYSLTLNYKQDLIHHPFIKRKLGIK